MTTPMEDKFVRITATVMDQFNRVRTNGVCTEADFLTGLETLIRVAESTAAPLRQPTATTVSTSPVIETVEPTPEAVEDAPDDTEDDEEEDDTDYSSEDDEDKS